MELIVTEAQGDVLTVRLPYGVVFVVKSTRGSGDVGTLNKGLAGVTAIVTLLIRGGALCFVLSSVGYTDQESALLSPAQVGSRLPPVRLWHGRVFVREGIVTCVGREFRRRDL